VEHFGWLHPLFAERLGIRDGRMHLSDRPGLGITLTEQARVWTVQHADIT
jgi:L-talarate/galactarate dehydratase